MKLKIGARLIMGLLLLSLAACEPVTDNEPEQSSNQVTPVATTAASTSIASQPATTTPGTETDPTSSPPPAPTAAPTTDTFTSWQQIGGEANGMQLHAPPAWVNLSGQLDTPAVANELGLIVLLLANSTRTGSSLLAGKGIDTGAYVAGLISHLDLPPNTPQAGLNRLLAELAPARTILSTPELINVNGSNGRLTGAYVDLEGAPLLFPGAGETVPETAVLRTRLFLFSSPLSAAANQQTQAIFLMSAPPAAWDNYAPTFTRMAGTIAVHNLYADVLIRDGSANMIGELTSSTLVNGELQPNVKDVWTFSVTETPQYATLSLNARQDDLDVTFNLISPDGQTILQVDNGYAGVSESAIDVVLIKPGVYVVEIGDFFNTGGRYALSLVLTPEPLFGGGGDIRIGQTIQSNLAINGQQVWHFTGNAGDLISIVLTPENMFDPILELFGPDGRQLAGLDEGFSGDAELLNGFPLPLTGEYTILVRSFAGDGGEYALSLDAGSESTLNFYDAGDLIYGQTAEESLLNNEAHAWFFNGREGDRVTITAAPLSGILDLDVWLLDPDINRLAAQDALLAGEPETLTYTLPRDGQFVILVRDFFGAAGPYQIQLDGAISAAPVDMGLLMYGDTITDTLRAGQELLWYFDAQEGDKVAVNITPLTAGVDLIFELVSPSGTIVAQVDASAVGQAELLEGYQVMGDGRYAIVIREFFGTETNYTLSLENQ